MVLELGIPRDDDAADRTARTEPDLDTDHAQVRIVVEVSAVRRERRFDRRLDPARGRPLEGLDPHEATSPTSPSSAPVCGWTTTAVQRQFGCSGGISVAPYSPT